MKGYTHNVDRAACYLSPETSLGYRTWMPDATFQSGWVETQLGVMGVLVRRSKEEGDFTTLTFILGPECHKRIFDKAYSSRYCITLAKAWVQEFYDG